MPEGKCGRRFSVIWDIFILIFISCLDSTWTCAHIQLYCASIASWRAIRHSVLLIPPISRTVPRSCPTNRIFRRQLQSAVRLKSELQFVTSKMKNKKKLKLNTEKKTKKPRINREMMGAKEEKLAENSLREKQSDVIIKLLTAFNYA